MSELEVIAKGAYVYAQSDARLPLKEFVFFYENGKKYLLLKWRNLRRETLCGIRLNIAFRDAAGAEIGRETRSFDGLHAAANADLLLPKIEVSQECVDFKADLILSRYGQYVYTVGEDGVAVEYAPRVQNAQTGAYSQAKQVKDFQARVDRPAYSAWIVAFFCLLLACLVVFTCIRINDFKNHSYSFLKDGVEYSFIGDRDDENSELMVTGYHGSRKRITVYDAIEGHRVTEIYERAFEGYYELEEVTLKGSVRIGYKAFSNCHSLLSINLEGTTEIGDYAFDNCGRLRSFEADNLSLIGDYAFYRCYSLRDIVIRNEQKSLRIGRSAFEGSGEISSIVIDQTIDYSYNTEIFNGLYSVSRLELQNFPGSGGRAVTLPTLFGGRYGIYVYALKIGHIYEIPANFCDSVSLTSLEIETIENPVVGDYAFDNCWNLTELKLPPVREIGQYALRNALFETFDGSELETIAPYAFYNCYNLKSIDFGDRLREIGDCAFYSCNRLTSLFVPPSVDHIGVSAFEDCHAVSELTIPFLGNSKNAEDGKLSDIFGARPPSELHTVTVSEPFEIVSEYAFAYCDRLERVNLPVSVVSVGANAFNGCASLTTFELPPHLVSIGEKAFADCAWLDCITLPAPLKSIGKDAFSGCYRLYEVQNKSRLDLSVPEIVGRVSEYALKIHEDTGFAERIESDGFTFADIDGEWFLVGYPRENYVQELPAFIAPKIIKYRVANRLFSGDNSLSRVNIPPTVYEMGKYAFDSCPMLRTVVFEEGSTLIVLEEGMFNCCGYLKNVTLPERLKSIGPYAFRSCSSLTSIVLPETLTAIKEQAFLDCKALKRVYNLSALPIMKNSQNYGYVAYYAENIYTALEEEDEKD